MLIKRQINNADKGIYLNIVKGGGDINVINGRWRIYLFYVVKGNEWKIYSKRVQHNPLT